MKWDVSTNQVSTSVRKSNAWLSSRRSVFSCFPGRWVSVGQRGVPAAARLQRGAQQGLRGTGPPTHRHGHMGSPQWVQGEADEPRGCYWVGGGNKLYRGGAWASLHKYVGCTAKWPILKEVIHIISCSLSENNKGVTFCSVFYGLKSDSASFSLLQP